MRFRQRSIAINPGSGHPPTKGTLAITVESLVSGRWARIAAVLSPRKRVIMAIRCPSWNRRKRTLSTGRRSGPQSA